MTLTYLYITETFTKHMGLGGTVEDFCKFLIAGMAAGDSVLSDEDSNDALMDAIASSIDLLPADQWIYVALVDNPNTGASFSFATGSKDLIAGAMAADAERHKLLSEEYARAIGRKDRETVH